MGDKMYSNQETTCWIRPEALHGDCFEFLRMSKGSPDSQLMKISSRSFRPIQTFWVASLTLWQWK